MGLAARSQICGTQHKRADYIDMPDAGSATLVFEEPRLPQASGVCWIVSESLPSLSGLRVLVMEDDFLIADLLSFTLEEFGCVVIGPFADVSSGLKAIEDEVPDGAVLDANLRGDTTSGPIAEALKAASLPFVVTTGYGTHELADAVLNGAPRVAKPFNQADLEAALQTAFANPGSA